MLRVIYGRALHAGPSGPLCFARIYFDSGHVYYIAIW